MEGNTPEKPQKSDLELLLEAMAGLAEGSFSDVDKEAFSDPAVGEAYNSMLLGITDRNNRFLARINDAMFRIGYSGNIQKLLEEIETQQAAIKILLRAREELSFSMKKAEESVLEMLALSRQIRNSYEPFTQDLTNNYQNVQDSLDSTKDIIDEIKTLEVATISDEDRVAYLQEFVAVMETFVGSVEKQKDSIVETADNLISLKGRIEAVINDILEINKNVERQNASSARFLKGVDSIATTHDALSMDALGTGNQIYRICRDIDNARNDLFRQNSRPTIHDTLRVYEADHFILTWRVYNHIVELETLKITQLNNPDRCKFGLWCQNVTDEYILESEEFRAAFDAHVDLHKHAVAAYMAKDDFDLGLAKKEFTKTLDAFGRMQMSLEALHNLYTDHGMLDETPIWRFK